MRGCSWADGWLRWPRVHARGWKRVRCATRCDCLFALARAEIIQFSKWYLVRANAAGDIGVHDFLSGARARSRSRPFCRLCTGKLYTNCSGHVLFHVCIHTGISGQAGQRRRRRRRQRLRVLLSTFKWCAYGRRWTIRMCH